MEEVGINYYVDHYESGHRVIITDTLSGFKPMDSVAYQKVYCYPPDLKLQEEYISRFEPLQQHVSGQIRLNDYQFKQSTADQTSISHQPWDTAHNALEVYEWTQGDYISHAEGGDHKAKHYMESIRQHGHRAIAAGNLRGIQSGHSLIIANHPSEDSNRSWIVLGTIFEATETSQETSATAQYRVNVQFTLQPDNEQIRPDRIIQKPQAKSQTAIVVGPKDKEVWVDQYGRVKVQFHWDRYGQNNETAPAGYGSVPPGKAPTLEVFTIHESDKKSSSTSLTPTQTCPMLADGSPTPTTQPYGSYPGQHALSGFKSKEIDGSQNNHLIMDDTSKQIQLQLTSDHQLSQLNLGYITRIPDVAGRKDYRGQGMELRTDGWGAIRAAKGMMLSTYSRASGSSHIKDLKEIIGVLKSAQNQHKSFAELAIDHKADERTIDDTAQVQLLNQNHDISGEAHPSDIANDAAAKAKQSAMTAPDPSTGASWKTKTDQPQKTSSTDKDKFPELQPTAPCSR